MRLRSLLIGLVIVASFAAHWSRAYRPRERSGVLDSNSLVGALFLESDLPYRAWLPYPHQNLGELERAIGDLDRFLGAIGDLSGRDLARLPSFGSFRLPPSSELVVASDESGETFVAAARVYPVAGLLARLAGRLAGNALLSGGETEIDGRPVSVTWRDGFWVVATPGAGVPEAGPSSGQPADGRALGRAILARPRGYLPVGKYRLRRARSGLELTTEDSPALARLSRLDASLPPVPLLLVEAFATEENFAGRSLALLPGIESIGGLPGAAALHRGDRRWRLPGESLLKLVGDGPPRFESAGWQIVALDEESLGRGVDVVPYLSQLGGSKLSLGAWIHLSEAHQLVEQTVAALEAVPIVGRRQARRWRALSVALEPLLDRGWLTAIISESPPAVLIRLGRSESSSPASSQN